MWPTIFTRSVRTEDKIIVTSNKKLKCNATNTYPFVIHGLANMNLDDIAREILDLKIIKVKRHFFI